MKIRNTIIGLLGLLVLLGCSSDDAQQAMLMVEATVSAPDYADAADARSGDVSEGRKITRSWTPPTSYYLYSELYSGSVYANYERLDNKTIDVFFTQNVAEGPMNPLNGRLRYVSSTDKWKLVLPNTVNPDDVHAGDYYVYGFLPQSAADNATITPNPTYDKGAVLTINGMQTVMADACVIIGAKHGPDADHDGGLTAGNFMFNLKKGESENNYMYLLFDHLCSALSLSMRVYGDYNDLRTIKVKEIRLQTASNSGKTKKKMNVTVTLNGNNTGSNPIESITYTPTGEEECDGIVFQSDEGLELSTSYSMFLSHFVPQGVTKLILTTTYDVYDKKGNLIRLNSKATNTILVTDIIDRLDAAERGSKYIINMTIQPTYLYVLSDPDLDNPTMTID